jgi:hypothetical protein
MSCFRWSTYDAIHKSRPFMGAAFLIALCSVLGDGGPGEALADDPGQRDSELGQMAQEALDRVQADLDHGPADLPHFVRRARLHFTRLGVLTLKAHEQHLSSSARGCAETHEEYVAWRRCYLTTDPAHAVSDTLRAASQALRQRPQTSDRLDLLLILATVRCYLGQHREEAAALREAVPLAADPRIHIYRLARAYSEARRFRQAEAVLTAWGGQLDANGKSIYPR